MKMIVTLRLKKILIFFQDTKLLYFVKWNSPKKLLIFQEGTFHILGKNF